MFYCIIVLDHYALVNYACISQLASVSKPPGFNIFIFVLILLPVLTFPMDFVRMEFDFVISAGAYAYSL